MAETLGGTTGPPRPAAEAPASRLSTWAGLTALALFLLLLWVAADLVGLVVLGAVLAYLLAPLVNWLERRGVRRTLGAVLVLLVVLASVGAVLALAVPLALDQAVSLRARWEDGELLALVRQVEAGLAARLSFLEPDDLGLVRSIQEAVEPGEAALAGYVPTALEAAVNTVVVPFVLFALLRNGPDLRRRALAFVPNRYFEFAMTVFYKADAHLGGYLRGQALVALLVGASTTLGLGALGVDYWLVLGLVTGLANFVPYIGFVVSAGLSVVVSIVTTGSTDLVVPVLVLYAVVQTVENVVFQPFITGRNVSMHPVLVLLAILVGGRVAGVFGMALAVPTAAVLKVFFVETAVSLRRYHL
jgi:predicted PurR-regulated permease PerM